jgi:hypothetical protein
MHQVARTQSRAGPCPDRNRATVVQAAADAGGDGDDRRVRLRYYRHLPSNSTCVPDERECAQRCALTPWRLDAARDEWCDARSLSSMMRAHGSGGNIYWTAERRAPLVGSGAKASRPHLVYVLLSHLAPLEARPRRLARRALPNPQALRTPSCHNRIFTRRAGWTAERRVVADR